MVISILIAQPSFLTDCCVWLWVSEGAAAVSPAAKISLSDPALPLEMPPLSQKIYFVKLLKLRDWEEKFYEKFPHIW